MAIADEVAAAVLAGFKQGVIAEAKRQSVMIGKEVVRELPGALTDTGALVNQALMFVEDTAEMVPATKKKRSKSAKAADKKLSAAFKEANRRYRKKDGSLRAGRTQGDIARLAHKLRKKGTTKGEVRKTARRAFERR